MTNVRERIENRISHHSKDEETNHVTIKCGKYYCRGRILGN